MQSSLISPFSSHNKIMSPMTLIQVAMKLSSHMLKY